MSRLKQTKGFTDQFRDIINLTPEQVIDIDNLEFENYKEYFWNNSLNENRLKFRLLIKIFRLLTSNQILLLKEYKRAVLLKSESKKEEKRQQSFVYEKNRLATLKLEDNKIWEYVFAKEDLMKSYKDKMIAQAKLGMKISEVKDQLEEEIFRPIFTENQYSSYKDILKYEREARKSFSIKQSLHNFEYQYSIKLNDDQAKAFFEIENKTNDIDGNGKCYSVFEQEELKLIAYESILDQDQFNSYRTYHEKRIEQHKEELIKSNNNHHLQQLNRTKDYLEYYILNVLPALTMSRKKLDVFLTTRQKEIIEEINVFYFNKLAMTKKNFISNHERYNKNLVPNELLEYNLRHKLDCISPNIFWLKNHSSTKELMTETIVKEIKIEKIKLEKIYGDLKKFQIENYENTGGEYGLGWLIRIPDDESEEHLKHISILLIESDIERNIARMER